MNLFYEKYPCSVCIDGEFIPIITDFREVIRLMDMLKDSKIVPREKVQFILQYFGKHPSNLEKAISAYTDFISMKEMDKTVNDDSEGIEVAPKSKTLFSFELDYPYIFSAFLRDYQINLQTIPYMHWWEFRLLFDGLSEDTEIKQRIMYRSINLNEIKDDQERRRIAKIQRMIMLPEESLTDYDIGDALW